MINEEQIKQLEEIAEKMNRVACAVETIGQTQFKTVMALSILAGLFADLADGVELNAEQRQLLTQLRAIGQAAQSETRIERQGARTDLELPQHFAEVSQPQAASLTIIHRNVETMLAPSWTNCRLTWYGYVVFNTDNLGTPSALRPTGFSRARATLAPSSVVELIDPRRL